MDNVEHQLRILEHQEDEIDRKRDELEEQAERDMEPILDQAIRGGVASTVR